MTQASGLLILLLLTAALAGCQDAGSDEGSSVGVEYQNNYGMTLYQVVTTSAIERDPESGRGSLDIPTHQQRVQFGCEFSHPISWIRFEIYKDRDLTQKLDDQTFDVECYGDYILAIGTDGKMTWREDPDPPLGN